jgi:hypothetical protein
MDIREIIFHSDKVLIQSLGNLLARLAGVEEEDSNQHYSDQEAESFARSRVTLQRQQLQRDQDN